MTDLPDPTAERLEDFPAWWPTAEELKAEGLEAYPIWWCSRHNRVMPYRTTCYGDGNFLDVDPLDDCRRVLALVILEATDA